MNNSRMKKRNLKNFKRTKERKKGNISVVVLVWIVVVLCVASIFYFITGAREIEATIVSGRAIENLKYEKNFVEFHLRDISEEVFLKTYFDFIDNGDFIDSYKKFSDKGKYGHGVQSFFSEDELAEEFNKKFRKNLVSKSGFLKNFIEDHLKGNPLSDRRNFNNLVDRLDEGDFEMKYYDGVLNIEIPNEKFSLISGNDGSGIKAKYITNISAEIPFNKLGLLSFEDFELITKYKDSCLSEDSDEEMNSNDKKECYEDGEALEYKEKIEDKGFDVKVSILDNKPEDSDSNSNSEKESEEEKEVVLKFSSNKKFFIGEEGENSDGGEYGELKGKFKKVEFEFIPK